MTTWSAEPGSASAWPKRLRLPEMPPEVASILKNNAASIFSKHFSGSSDYRDTLAKIEAQANEKWSQLLGS